MSVAEREREREQRSRENFGDVRNVASYQPPGILATLKGRPVRIIATGDMPGHSPVCQYVDEDGRMNWNELEQFTVIDRPVRVELLIGASQQLQNPRYVDPAIGEIWTGLKRPSMRTITV